LLICYVMIETILICDTHNFDLVYVPAERATCLIMQYHKWSVLKITNKMSWKSDV
jgi:hypothetical protein